MTNQSLSTHPQAALRVPGLRDVVSTRDEVAPLVGRLTLAIVLFPHGAQKLLGWFGGYGFGGTMDYFTAHVGLPWLLAFAVILLEFFGPLLLAAGLVARPVALATIGLMIGAVLTSHTQYGFFMNWTGTQEGEGFEFHILMIGLAIVVLIQGAGRASVDGRLASRASRVASIEA